MNNSENHPGKEQRSRTARIVLISFLLIFFTGVGIVYWILQEEKFKPLKIYQPVDINPRLVDESLRSQKSDHRVSDFSLVNQLGDTVSLSDLQGKIYVADFFFTRCPTICPVMSSNLEQVQQAFEQYPDVMILSHSVTPEADSVPVMKEYADLHGADHGRWWFLTGPKTEIYRLARKSYFAVLDEGDGGMQDFIHTENFILVDKERRLRGFYDGTKQTEIDRLINDIFTLLKEYDEVR